MKHKLGWIRDPHDERDYQFKSGLLDRLMAKDHSDLSHLVSIYDQLVIGSCTAQALAQAVRMCRLINGKEPFDPSRLFIYFAERELEGTINEDAGAIIRDGCKVLAKLGAPHESLWPYDVSKFRERPSKTAYDDAMDQQVIRYYRLPQALLSMRACLSTGYPFVFGFKVYENFETIGADGIMPTPHGECLGGHAVIAVGHDDKTKRIKVANSWGTTFGDKGFFYMPYSVTVSPRLCNDFWTIREVE